MLIYGNLEYLMEIGDILWPFGTFCTHLEHFFRFWYHVPRKICQPCPEVDCSLICEDYLGGQIQRLS
jgi:hypothetical protein